MKSFAKPLEQGIWRVYVTDNDCETYSTVVAKEEPPSKNEMERMFESKKESFIEVN